MVYPEPVLEGIAGRFKILAEPMRLRVLQALRPGERSVGELVDSLGATQANISKHLAVLHREGMVARRKEGLHVFYRVADASIFRLCEVVCGTLERQAADHVRRLRPAARRRN